MDETLDEAYFIPDYDEEENKENRPPGVTRRRGRKGKACHVCQERFTHARRHAVMEHLPWYCSPLTACSVCQLQFGREGFLKSNQIEYHQEEVCVVAIDKWINLMYGLLVRIISHVKCGESLSSLLQFATENGMVMQWTGLLFQPMEITWIEMFCDQFCSAEKVTGTVPAYNVHSLLHWRILASLLQVADSAHLLTNDLPIPELLQNNIQPIDAHFHLDMWRKRVGVSDSLPPWNKEHTSLQALVANFCYPRNWPSTAERESIRKDQKMYLTFGVHPRLVGLESEITQQRWLRDLHSMCKAKKIVATGECGFDTTDHPPAKIHDFQQQIFEEHAQIAVNLCLVTASQAM